MSSVSLYRNGRGQAVTTLTFIMGNPYIINRVSIRSLNVLGILVSSLEGTFGGVNDTCCVIADERINGTLRSDAMFMRND
jgi:hypothetical protein